MKTSLIKWFTKGWKKELIRMFSGFLRKLTNLPMLSMKKSPESETED